MGGVDGLIEGGIAGTTPSDCGIRTRGGDEAGGISDHDTGSTSWAGMAEVETGCALAGIGVMLPAVAVAGGLLTVEGVFQSNGLDGVAEAADDCPADGVAKLLCSGGKGSPE